MLGCILVGLTQRRIVLQSSTSPRSLAVRRLDPIGPWRIRVWIRQGSGSHRISFVAAFEDTSRTV